jgi:hypothetical protein
VNLHGIAGPIIAAVNPTVAATLKTSNGTYTTAGDGTLTPNYDSASIRAQVQALGWKDLQMLDGINLGGLRKAMYLFGDVEAVNRKAARGGDLIVFGSTAPAPLTNTVWLVAMQLEGWGGSAPDLWCKVAATLQQDAVP